MTGDRAALLVLLAAATPARAQSALPDPARTPGALNPEVTDTAGSFLGDFRTPSGVRNSSR
jgi:hypothetical protein